MRAKLGYLYSIIIRVPKDLSWLPFCLSKVLQLFLCLEVYEFINTACFSY